MVPQCGSVWQNGDFTPCFIQVYLQGIIPLVLIGVSFLFFLAQLVNLWLRSSRNNGYATIPQNEDAIPTQHYHDDPDEGEEDKVSPNPYIETSKPKRQVLRIFIEFVTTCFALAINVFLYFITHEVAPLVFWTYTTFLVMARILVLRRPKLPLQLWYHTTLLYFLQFAIALLVLRSTTIRPYEQPEVKELVLANFVLVLILALITGTTRVGNKTVQLEHEDDLVSSKEPLSSLFSALTFSWADPIIWKGSQKTCEIEDVWNLAPEDKAGNVISSYKKLRKNRPLFLHLLYILRGRLFVQALWAVIGSLLIFFPTILLKAIVEYVEKPGDTPASAAWFWVVLLLVCSCFQSIGDGQALWTGRKMSANMTAVTIGEIYAKALRRKAALKTSLDSDDKKDQAQATSNSSTGGEAAKAEEAKAPDSQANSGTIVNLMSSDSQRISDVTAYLHWLWGSVPIQLVLSVVLLYRTLGWSAYMGMIPMVIFFTAGLYISSKFFNIQKKIMKATDMRLETTNETLINIRIIKYFAWEHRFNDKIEATRKKELTHLRNMFLLYLVNEAIFVSIPFLVNLVAFLSYTLIEHRPLKPSVAFTTISLFQLLSTPLSELGFLIMHVANFKVSADRVEKFMEEEETEKYEQLKDGTSDATGQEVVGFDNATFAWGGSEDVAEDGSRTFRLIDLNIRFSLGQLNIVAGPTGSGKTSLLMALLGEITKINKGKVYLPGGYDRSTLRPDPVTGLTESVAYCSQTAWLLNGTVRENILFSSAFDSQRYDDVLRACALKPDIAIWTDGDATLVGEKGITLSGGQKQRISLARALYSNSKFVLLDDILSAVDSHTGKWLFDKCLRGPLMAKRTCILVTHNVALCLPKADFVVILDNGTVAFQGNSKDAMNSGLLGENILSTPTPEAEKSEPHSNAVAETSATADAKDKVDPRLETKATGRVSWTVVSLYLSSMGRLYFWVFWAVLYGVHQIAGVLPNIWIREWSNQYVPHDSFLTSARSFFSGYQLPAWKWIILPITNFENHNSVSASIDNPVDVGYYVGIYAAIGASYVVIGLTVSGVVWFGSLRASYSLHSRLLTTITRAKLTFFDSTPLGQILNRFSKDIKQVDQELAVFVVEVLNLLGRVIMVLVLICAVTPQFLIPGAILCVIYFYVAKFYLAASTDLKRMESVAKSPIYQSFSETLSGVTTIRAYGEEKRFILDNYKKINVANRPYIFLWALNRWLAIRLDFTGAFISFFAAAFIVWRADVIDAGAAGLSLAYALQFTQQILMLVRFYGMTEQNFNSVERVHQYLQVESEAPAEIEETRPPADWPAEGSIEFVNYATSYRPDLPPVLKNLNLTISGKQKVGVVGRTGAGKSSLALALLRALEAQEGKILIDGIDIGNIGLNDLRNSLTMVPQDPTLFTGTIRSNLDPFNLYTDEEIFTALRNVHLIDSPSTSISGTATPVPPVNNPETTPSASGNNETSSQNGNETSTTTTLNPPDLSKINKTPFTNLSYPITESGSNLSGGQRQLLCLVRALLKQPRLLIMDEATASIDYNTDKKIQETIRSGLLKDTTVITVAHRLMTIVDYDLVVVLDKGEVVECGVPWELLGDGGNGKGKRVFRGMCEETGDFEALRKKAEEAWKVRNGE